MGNENINPLDLIKNIKVVEGTYSKTFVVDKNELKRNGSIPRPQKWYQTLHKTSSMVNLSTIQRKPTNKTCGFTKLPISRNHSANLSKRMPSSPRKKLRTGSIDSSIVVFDIQNKFGLKLPKLKQEKSVNRYFNDNDFYY
jgi:hypothetical protein